VNECAGRIARIKTRALQPQAVSTRFAKTRFEAQQGLAFD
jgi:hypothetical protein